VRRDGKLQSIENRAANRGALADEFTLN